MLSPSIVGCVTAAACVAACGRLGFGGAGGGASVDGAAGPLTIGDGGTTGPDGAAMMTSCSSWSAFSAPVSLDALNSTSLDWGPTVSDDELTIVFVSERSGGGSRRKLWTASRTDRSLAFGPPTQLTTTDLSGTEDNPTLGGDGLTIVYDRNAGSSPMPTLATRTALADAFTNPPTDIVLGLQAMPAGASLSSDTLTLTYTTTATFGLGIASRPTRSDPFVDEGAIALDTGSDESWPWLSDDRLELFFISNTKIMTTRRTDVGQDFPPASLVPELDGGPTTHEADPEISADGRTIYFASDRAPTVGSWDVWMATRTCL